MFSICKKGNKGILNRLYSSSNKRVIISIAYYIENKSLLTSVNVKLPYYWKNK